MKKDEAKTEIRKFIDDRAELSVASATHPRTELFYNYVRKKFRLMDHDRGIEHQFDDLDSAFDYYANLTKLY